MKSIPTTQMQTRLETIKKMQAELSAREEKLLNKFIEDKQKLVDKKMALLEKKLSKM